MKLIIEYDETFIISKMYDNHSVSHSTDSVAELRFELENYIEEVLKQCKY